jgi:DNA-binding transcriptional regulator YiaG
LAACNVVAKAYGPAPKVDVKAIRETMELSQEQFALEFGLELATVRNWEQGRSEPARRPEFPCHHRPRTQCGEAGFGV